MDTLLLPYTVAHRLAQSDPDDKAPSPAPLVATQPVAQDAGFAAPVSWYFGSHESE